MEDRKIIERFFARNEDAIKHTDDTYGRRLYLLEDNIVHNGQDAEESVSNVRCEKRWSGELFLRQHRLGGDCGLRRIFCPNRAVRKMGNTSSIPAFFILSLVSKHWPNLLAPLCGAALKKTTPHRGVEGLCGSMPVIPTEECAEAHPLSERWRRLPPLSFPRDCRTPRSHRPRELHEQRLQECRIRYRQP